MAAIKNYFTMALDSDCETSLFDVIGFTLDDIETVEIPYHDNGTPRCRKLDLDRVKMLLAPLDQVKRRFTKKPLESPYQLLLTLKHGSQGENVGELRRLNGDQGCGQIIITFSLAKDGSCLYCPASQKDGYTYRYYSPEVAKLLAFISHE